MDHSSNQQFYTQPRPAFPQASSTQSSMTASAFQSSSSLSSLASISTSPSQTNMSSRHSPSLYSAAPLPSPSSQPPQFFGSLPPPMTHQNAHGFQQFGQQPQQQTSQVPQQQRLGQRGNGGGAPDTTAFLQDFSLIAEAAKRAQMAVMMRDFDDLEM